MADNPRYEPCTKEDLLLVLRETLDQNALQSRPPRSGAQPSPWKFVWTITPKTSYDEVYPGIFVGDQSIAKDKDLLRTLHVTHIVNAAQGQRFAQVDTNSDFYADLNIRFYGINSMDTARFNISAYFTEAANFIHGALMQGGRVVVHCDTGISRSPALVIAYLMLKEGKPVRAAIRTVRQKRQVQPNNGFLKQLCWLNDELFRDRFTL